MLKKLVAMLAVGFAAATLPAVASDGNSDERRSESTTSETQKANPPSTDSHSDRSAPDAGKEAGK